MKKIFENAQFFVLICLIVAQCVVAENFYLGQGLYLLANLTSSARCFLLSRPLADKIKDVACLGISLGLILIRMFNS